MEEDNAAVQAQKVAVPAFLTKRLHAFRIGKGERQSYLLQDKLHNKTYDFEPWQFFVLEVLPGCEDAAKLTGVFQDRFARPLPEKDLHLLFADIADADLFADEAATHPLLAPFCQKRYAEENGQPKLKSFRAAVAEAHLKPVEAVPQQQSAKAPKKDAKPAAAPKVLGPDDVLPAGVQDAIGLDPRATRMLVLFDPRPLLKVFAPLFTPVKYLVYLLPLVAFVGIYLAVQHATLIRTDLDRLLGHLNWIRHSAYSLISIDVLETITAAVIGFRFRATVDAIGVVLLMSFIPRFSARITHTEQLSRTERMWLHGARLLVRTAVFSLSIIAWYITRNSNSKLSAIALGLALISLTGFVLTANPLVKGSGYHFLSAFTNEPHLRGKAYKVLLGKMTGRSYKEGDNLILSAYALSATIFMFVMICAAVTVASVGLKQVKVGDSALLLGGVLGTILLWRFFPYLGKIKETYERSVQFDRWRNRALPVEVEQAPEQKTNPLVRYFWRVAFLFLVVAAFQPYHYTPGGDFIVYPRVQQVVATDVSGIVKEVLFQGGESVKKGTVIALLDTTETRAEIDILAARMRQQKSVVDELKSRPRYQEVQLAQQAVQVQRTRSDFSLAELGRLDNLYKHGAISLEEFDKTRREHDVDQRQLTQTLAALDVARMGAPKDQILAAQAQWEALKAEHDQYVSKLERSVLKMPVDGKLLTLHLQQKANAFYKGGDAFAGAEDTGQVTAEIEVAESDIGYVRIGSAVNARPTSYSFESFKGKITLIDWNVTEKATGNVIKAIASFDNSDGRLINGMKGYAKVEGPTLPAWKAFSLAVLRFFNLEVWSWIP